MYNIEEVTDAVEKSLAKVELEQTGRSGCRGHAGYSQEEIDLYPVKN